VSNYPVDTLIGLLDVSAPPLLEYVFSRRPSTLEVIVDRPLDRDAGTVVIVPDPYVPSELPLSRPTVLTPDLAGLGIARDLVPGAYRVFAFEHFDPPEDLDPAVLKSLEKSSGRIVLTEGQTGRISVKWAAPPVN
jgi:hypothetical protein